MVLTLSYLEKVVSDNRSDNVKSGFQLFTATDFDNVSVHLKVHRPGAVLVYLSNHLNELLCAGVVSHGAQHHTQLLESDALVTVHIEQVKYRPGQVTCDPVYMSSQ